MKLGSKKERGEHAIPEDLEDDCFFSSANKL